MKRSATSAELRDRQKVKELKRIADALESLNYLLESAGTALGNAAATIYARFGQGQAPQPPERPQ